MIEVIDLFTISFMILILTIVQSLLGVGLLLFGTPTLLIIGYSYSETLWMILPSSILISLTQVIFDKDLIKSKKSIFLLTAFLSLLINGNNTFKSILDISVGRLNLISNFSTLLNLSSDK